MKAFLPFVLLPALGVAGWWLGAHTGDTTALGLPSPVRLDPPPALGVVLAPPDGQGPVTVRMDALLPRPASKSEVKRPALAPTTAPVVQAILVHGHRRVVQVDGQPLAQGDRYGVLRIAAIEPDRVLFEYPGRGQQLWVSVSEQ